MLKIRRSHDRLILGRGPEILNIETICPFYPCPTGAITTLTHWGRVTHICVGNLTIIGPDNGLSPGRRQAIIWTNAGILLIGPWGTNFSEISIGIQTFSFKKMLLTMLSAISWDFIVHFERLVFFNEKFYSKTRKKHCRNTFNFNVHAAPTDGLVSFGTRSSACVCAGYHHFIGLFHHLQTWLNFYLSMDT